MQPFQKFMLVLAVLGLALGIPLAIEGWEGLGRVLIFFAEHGARVLGGILVGLSVAVIIRQLRPRAAAPPQPPAFSQTPPKAPQASSPSSHPESPPA